MRGTAAQEASSSAPSCSVAYLEAPALLFCMQYAKQIVRSCELAAHLQQPVGALSLDVEAPAALYASGRNVARQAQSAARPVGLHRRVQHPQSRRQGHQCGPASQPAHSSKRVILRSLVLARSTQRDYLSSAAGQSSTCKIGPNTSDRSSTNGNDCCWFCATRTSASISLLSNLQRRGAVVTSINICHRRSVANFDQHLRCSK